MRPLLSSALTTLVLGCALRNTLATLLSIDTFGAVQNDASANVTNMQAFQRALDASGPGDTVLVPEGTYQLVGGVRGTGLINVTVQIDGTLEYLHDLDHWPIPDDSTDGKYANLLEFQDSSFVTVMSSTGAGLLDGGGKPWWNQYLVSCSFDTNPNHRHHPHTTRTHTRAHILTTPPITTGPFRSTGTTCAPRASTLIDAPTSWWRASPS